jgi:hypothetical protein
MRSVILRSLVAAGLVCGALVVARRSDIPADTQLARASPRSQADTAVAPPAATTAAPLPGMPPVPHPTDISTETRPGKLSPVVRQFPALVYVPSSASHTVDVID